MICQSIKHYMYVCMYDNHVLTFLVKQLFLLSVRPVELDLGHSLKWFLFILSKYYRLLSTEHKGCEHTLFLNMKRKSNEFNTNQNLKAELFVANEMLKLIKHNHSGRSNWVLKNGKETWVREIKNIKAHNWEEVGKYKPLILLPEKTDDCPLPSNCRDKVWSLPCSDDWILFGWHIFRGTRTLNFLSNKTMNKGSLLSWVNKLLVMSKWTYGYVHVCCWYNSKETSHKYPDLHVLQVNTKTDSSAVAGELSART